MEGAGDDAGVAGEGGDVGAGRVRPIRQAADDPGWPHYADTVIEFRRRGRVVHLDCRVPMTDEARRHLAAVGLPGAFVVVTACNPGGGGDGDGDGATDAARDAVDRRRTARLARRIRAAGRRPVRADGGSPDRTHVEPGWAADLPPATARRLAADAGQSAIFRFDGRRLWIEPVLVDAEPLPLPRPQSQSPEPPPLQPPPPPPRPS